MADDRAATSDLQWMPVAVVTMVGFEGSGVLYVAAGRRESTAGDDYE